MMQTTSLRTVLPEIVRDLAQAQQHLEFLYTSRDSEHIEKLHNIIKQSEGALKIAHLDDAAMLLRSLNDAVYKLNANEEEWDQQTIDNLAYPLFLVPQYCQWVIEQGMRNGPILLDAINHLRAYSNDHALVESELLDIKIITTHNPIKHLKREAAVDIQAQLARLVQLFNKGRRAINTQPIAALELLDKVATKLQYLCGNAPIAELFWLLSAILQAMQDGDLRLTKQRKQWLLLVEKYLINLYNSPESTLNKPISKAFKKEFLALIALSKSPRPLVIKLSQLYQIPKLGFSDRDIAYGIEQMHRPDSNLYHALAKSINAITEHLSNELMASYHSQQSINNVLNDLLISLPNIGAAVTLCELPHTMNLLQRCQQDIETLLQDPANNTAFERLMEGLLCLPERFKVMADQSLNAREKHYWTDIDDAELMQQRSYIYSQNKVYVNVIQQLSEIMLQLDLAYETGSGDIIESLLPKLSPLSASLQLLGEDQLAERVQTIYEILEPSTILLEKHDIENASWPLVSLYQAVTKNVHKHW